MPVPVGSVMYCGALPPDGYVIDSEFITWGGGTPYSSYPLGDPNQAPPIQASVTGPPETDKSAYTFIIDADPRAYTITLRARVKIS